MKQRLLQFTAICLIIQLFVFPLTPVWVHAEELPSKDQITQEIEAQAQEELAESQEEETPTQKTDVTSTGDDVSIESESQQMDETTVTNTNTAEVNQTINATANTGNNEASRNISFGGNAGVISTGNAAVVASSQVAANNNTTAISGTGESGGNTTTIGNTGNSLSSSSSQQSKQLTMVNSMNTAVIHQTTHATANTGNNTAKRNIAIGGGQASVIMTGNAYTQVDSLIAANGNVLLIGGNSMGNGPGSGASIVLVNTGNNPYIASRSQSYNNTSVSNTNAAYISQQCAPLCMANTGGNSSNRSIATRGPAGIIYTGNAVVVVGFDAQANSNTTISNATHGTDTKQSLDMTNTGDDAQVHTRASSSNKTQITNSNTARVDQVINAVANTGDNEANRNISFGGDAGVIVTGDAVVIANASATLNTNNTVAKQQDNTPKNTTPPPLANQTPIPTPTQTTGTVAQGTSTTSTSQNRSTNTVNNNRRTDANTPDSDDEDNKGTVMNTNNSPGDGSSRGGSVLGTSISQLPTTGPEETLLMLIAATLMLLSGFALRNTHTFASSHYQLQLQRKGV